MCCLLIISEGFSRRPSLWLGEAICSGKPVPQSQAGTAGQRRAGRSLAPLQYRSQFPEMGPALLDPHVNLEQQAKGLGEADHGNDPPPLKWSDLRYVFDIKEDRNGKEAIQA
jgi:hypothetical protein